MMTATIITMAVVMLRIMEAMLILAMPKNV